MSEVVCPLCRSVGAHRSKRAGFREEVLLRFLFARPYRCRKCNTRFYRVGKEMGFKLWIQERGALPSGPATDVLVPEEEEAMVGDRWSPRPPAFWLESMGAPQSNGTVSTLESDEDWDADVGDQASNVADERESGAALATTVRRRRPHRHSRHRRKMSRQTKIVLWLVVVLAIVAAALLYMFSLFSSAAKKQKLVLRSPEVRQTLLSAVCPQAGPSSGRRPAVPVSAPRFFRS